MKRKAPSLHIQISALFGLLSLSGSLVGQTAIQDSLPPLVHLGVAEVAPKPIVPAHQRFQPGSKRYRRLEKRVLKVWPYAAFAGKTMDSLETEMARIHSKRERRSIVDRKEKELKTQFEGDLRRLTMREGILLIRLIDREAQRTTFGVIRELKGRLSAFMWQGLAKLFGHDLKTEYDPTGEDAAIEHILHTHGLVPPQRLDTVGVSTLD